MPTMPLAEFTLADTTTPPNLDPDLITTLHAELVIAFAFTAGDLVLVQMSGSAIGGTFNQNFDLATNQNPLRVYIPKSSISPNLGGRVRLIWAYRRPTQAFVYSTESVVTIGRSSRPDPVETTSWNFQDGTLQGWNPQGPYAGGLLRVISAVLEINITTPRATRTHVITHPVRVVAGRVYEFSFKVLGRSTTDDGSRLQMSVDGVFFGTVIQHIVQGSEQTGRGTFTAANSGDVIVGIFNHAVPLGLHQFALDDLRMVQLP